MFIVQIYVQIESYVSNKSWPRGLIAKRYLAEEGMTFGSKYLIGLDTSLDQPRRNQENDDTKIDKRIDMFKNIVSALCSERAIEFDRTKLEDMHI